MEHFIVNLMLQVMTTFIKNPAKAAALKDVLLHIRDGITALFPQE